MSDSACAWAQEWADNLLLTARKAAPQAPALKRERSGSLESSRCSASPVNVPLGLPAGGGCGSGARMQRVLSNSKVSSGGRLHAPIVPAGECASTDSAADRETYVMLMQRAPVNLFNGCETTHVSMNGLERAVATGTRCMATRLPR